MLELLLCTVITILPNYFYNCVVGKESVIGTPLTYTFYELRWGISLCVTLTAILIVTNFYTHPFSSDVEIVDRGEAKADRDADLHVADGDRVLLEARFGALLQNSVKLGMIGEAICDSLPLEVIPVVVVSIRPMVNLGLTIQLEPLYKGGFEKLRSPGNCTANLYFQSEDLKDAASYQSRFFGTTIETILSFVPAMTLRLRGITRATILWGNSVLSRVI